MEFLRTNNQQKNYTSILLKYFLKNMKYFLPFRIKLEVVIYRYAINKKFNRGFDFYYVPLIF